MVYYALQTPTSTPREVAAYALVAAFGVVYLLIQGVNATDPAGIGFIAYLGASQAGIIVVNAAGKIAVLLPHTGTGTTPPPTS